MGMQKYRADLSRQQKDGATLWYADWMGGPSLAKVENCLLYNMIGEQRATVFVTGEPDTWFSVPAVCSYRGKRVRGYLTGDGDGNTVFHHCYY